MSTFSFSGRVYVCSRRGQATHVVENVRYDIDDRSELHACMEKSSVTVALDLLSLGSGEDAAESTEKTKERLLTASILQSKTSLWRHKV